MTVATVKRSIRRVGVDCPSFPDQKYIRDRDAWYTTESDEQAINAWMDDHKRWIREDEKHLVGVLERVPLDVEPIQPIQPVIEADDEPVGQTKVRLDRSPVIQIHEAMVAGKYIVVLMELATNRNGFKPADAITLVIAHGNNELDAPEDISDQSGSAAIGYVEYNGNSCMIVGEPMPVVRKPCREKAEIVPANDNDHTWDHYLAMARLIDRFGEDVIDDLLDIDINKYIG